ncbi:hypothetical protein ACP70R_003618 [Stipagrostis hirtigluma subsp. patula]
MLEGSRKGVSTWLWRQSFIIGFAATNVVGEVDITRVIRRQVNIIGSYGAEGHRQDLPQTVKLAESGAFNLQNTISRKCKFEEVISASQSGQDRWNDDDMIHVVPSLGQAICVCCLTALS